MNESVVWVCLVVYFASPRVFFRIVGRPFSATGLEGWFYSFLFGLGSLFAIMALDSELGFFLPRESDPHLGAGAVTDGGMFLWGILATLLNFIIALARRYIFPTSLTLRGALAASFNSMLSFVKGCISLPFRILRGILTAIRGIVLAPVKKCASLASSLRSRSRLNLYAAKQNRSAAPTPMNSHSESLPEKIETNSLRPRQTSGKSSHSPAPNYAMKQPFGNSPSGALASGIRAATADLLDCPECGKQFPNRADMCPECGCPTSVAEQWKRQQSAT